MSHCINWFTRICFRVIFYKVFYKLVCSKTCLTFCTVNHGVRKVCYVARSLPSFVVLENCTVKANNIIVALNASREPQTLRIPQGTYTEVCCDGVIDEAGLGTVQGGQIVVSPQSALILHN